jgi:hypothetical protein
VTAFSRRKYAGRGITELRTGATRSAVVLPSVDEAALLPNPVAALEALRMRFREVNGPKDDPHAFPNMSVRDARAFANVITSALRNDLPTIDVRDAAVIWEKWRQTVVAVRDRLRSVRDDTSIEQGSVSVLNACIILNLRSMDIRDSLVDAIEHPGEVASRYCPWAADFFTQQRLYPESL